MVSKPGPSHWTDLSSLSKEDGGGPRNPHFCPIPLAQPQCLIGNLDLPRWPIFSAQHIGWLPCISDILRRSTCRSCKLDKVSHESPKSILMPFSGEHPSKTSSQLSPPALQVSLVQVTFALWTGSYTITCKANSFFSSTLLSYHTCLISTFGRSSINFHF